MLIHRIAKQLLKADSYRKITQTLSQNQEATLAVSQSARPLITSALWAQNPRPCLVVVSGEEQADLYARIMQNWLDRDVVYRYPDRLDLPWQDKPADGAVIGARALALEALHKGKPAVVVASARALMRRIPPVEAQMFVSVTYAIGDETDFSAVPHTLQKMGYTNQAGVADPGTYNVHGDSVDVYPAQLKYPIRLEFFGDEIDRIASIMPSTGQTIQNLEEIEILSAREMALTEATIQKARKALYNEAQEESRVAADLEQIEAGIFSPELEKYLYQLYGKTASLADYVSKDTLVCLHEPRALFDECLRTYEELSAKANDARASLANLYSTPQEVDFGKTQRLNLVSLLMAGANPTASMQIKKPGIAGSDTKFINRIRELLNHDYKTLFAIPDRGAREFIEQSLMDERISFEESLAHDVKNRRELLDPQANTEVASLSDRIVTFIDTLIPTGCVIPEAELAILSVSDFQSKMAKRGQVKKIDPTEVTFPFKPGDYVVHVVHGIALFKDIVREEVDGQERDYFQLEYAEGDSLYVPLELVDRITRYVGPDSKNPRLTRLGTADWTRATNKARKSAKKLAFDLVDLYTRRSTVSGYAFSGDTGEQLEMEASFGYELTKDQARALDDIKADMESKKPMDRLLCGDVGFGKTEVALRAAFKCVEDGKQVMVLCPTTILAEQHFETFFDRFAPFDKEVAVLSRFVTPAKQKKALEAFAKGEVSVLVGTHRLLSNDVNPLNLGLVIIDEEQRFGVQHKEQLKNMREQIDVLTLSATPIPRTMQMAMSGVRDMSLIMTPPPGRKPVEVHVSEYDIDLIADAIRYEMHRGGQVYYISNRVNTIEDAYERVHSAVPEARIGIAHGKMSAREVEKIMYDFTQHEIDVLLATTIVESGIDNPHTNTLIIEDSHRLGLAQLYQLKGRVGRGYTQAHAYFMFPDNLPLTEEATERLLAINEHQELGSGMKIAMRDLEIRGAGSLMGAEQHGNLSSVGFDLFTQMLSQAVSEARGEVADTTQADVLINLSTTFFIDDEYIPEVDKRVLIYRKLACATDLRYLDELEQDVENTYGELPDATKHLFERAKLRIRAARLGISSISLVENRRIVFNGIQIPKSQLLKVKQAGALVYSTSHKVLWPYESHGEAAVTQALHVLEQLGGDDEE